MTASPLSLTYPMQLRPCEPASRGRLCWMAEHPDLPGCFGYGDTRSEAVRALSAARIAYITQLLAAGKEVPPPAQRVGVVEWGRLTETSPFAGTASWSRASAPAVNEDALASTPG